MKRIYSFRIINLLINLVLNIRSHKSSTYNINEEYFLKQGGPISNTFSTVSEYPRDGTLAFRHTSCDVLTFKANDTENEFVSIDSCEISYFFNLTYKNENAMCAKKCGNSRTENAKH